MIVIITAPDKRTINLHFLNTGPSETVTEYARHAKYIGNNLVRYLDTHQISQDIQEQKDQLAKELNRIESEWQRELDISIY